MIVQIPASAEVLEIARLVRAERLRQGLNQERLALVANVAVRSVHRIEHAEETVRFDTLLRVLNALGLELTIHRRGER
ncbi:MAG: helix-turn-helix domain-containing protein [Actinomycetota bacterium]|nr:helix-turn-helix domain-containing protein [Actinomycetota bacterium]